MTWCSGKCSQTRDRALRSVTCLRLSVCQISPQKGPVGPCPAWPPVAVVCSRMRAHGGFRATGCARPAASAGCRGASSLCPPRARPVSGPRPPPLLASLGPPGLVCALLYPLPSFFSVCRFDQGGSLHRSCLLCPFATKSNQFRALSLSSFVAQRCSIFP